MSLKLKPLDQQVIVVTGASSGIGLATALAAARRGARVVLSSRDQGALDVVAADIVANGGEALAIAADVGSREAVERVAQAAVARFGGFDTWVNDAGVAILGRLEEVDEADHRRLFDTNFWGVVHGSLAALPTLKARGGALINVGSIEGDEAVALQGMYSASKHAVKGFTNALRRELMAEGAPVSVTLVKPAAIGTPLADHFRNYEAEEPKLPPPIYAPEEVAAAILNAAHKPRREIYVGGAGRMLILGAAHAPRLADRLASTLGVAVQFSGRPAERRGDNLYEPGSGGGQVRGVKQGRGDLPSLYTRAVLHPLTTSVLLALATGGVAAGTMAVGGALARRRRGDA